MDLILIIILGIGLAMEVCSVSVCKGITVRKMKYISMVKVGLWFGVFQGIMVYAGHTVGNLFSEDIKTNGNIIVSIIVILMGFHLIWETGEKDNYCDEGNAYTDKKTMFLLSLATSIYGISGGIVFVLFEIKILPAVILISSISFLFSIMGIYIGRRTGKKYKKLIKSIGGLLFLILGIGILILF